MRRTSWAAGLLLGWAAFAWGAGGAIGAEPLPDVPPNEVEEALVAAGANRGELERALAWARASGDPHRDVAMRFLVANMPGKGYAVMVLRDAQGTTIPFDPLAFPDFAAAMAALDAIEVAHGKVDFQKDHVVHDVETLRSAFLVGHVDRAVGAWASAPAASRVGWRAFLEYVLPYRGSEEPVQEWLGPLLARYAEPPAPLGPAPSAQDLYAWLQEDVHRRVKFDERWYLHPTDQGFVEMEASGGGRCEDITNMITYAARARGLATAADYTPAWGHRDNNHAWNVLLDRDGRGSDPGNAHAAKVYRKTYAIQRGNLAFRLPPGREPANRWLAGKAYVDVTDQYAPTTDVPLTVDPARAAGESIAYLAVFNGGEWVAIHGASVAQGRAVLDRMGRHMLYLPAVHDGTALRPVGDPFVLARDGSSTPLPGTGPGVTLRATATSPATQSPDTKEVTPVSRLVPGTTYTLMRWSQEGWIEVSTRVADAGPLVFEGLPADGLYWLVAKDSRRTERPFVVDGGGQRFW